MSILNYLQYQALGVLVNAKIFGLPADLHLVGTQFNTLALMNGITHLAFQFPANLLNTWIRPSLYFPGITSTKALSP
jgi:hypothetical protein